MSTMPSAPSSSNYYAVVFTHFFGRISQFSPARQRLDLRLTSSLQKVDFMESLGHTPAAHQQTVIAQDHCLFRPEATNQAFALIVRQGDALVGVIRQLAVERQRMLANWQQALFLGRNGHSGRCVRMNHAR